jgi:uncharacterized protein YndB with AHSA1/START domain
MNPLNVESSITVNAPKAVVWDALTNPEKTKIYMFGCEAISDWTVGSPLIWRMEYEGKELIAVKGNIVRFEPETRLDYTVFDPQSTIEDIPENYLTVTYELTETDGKTHLVVTQGDYNTVAEGERRYQESDNGGEGWNPILIQIKELVENPAPLQ